MRLLNWFRSASHNRSLLAVCPAANGVTLALTERRQDGRATVKWVEHLALDSSPLSGQQSDETRSVEPVGGAREDRRAGQDRRQGDRRRGDRRTGDRRVGERRSGGDQGKLRGSDGNDTAPAGLGEFDALAPRLLGMVRKRELRKVPCAGLLRSGDYSLILVDSPDVPPAEIRAAMRWQVKELIDFHIDDAVIDVFDVPERDGRAGKRMYAVVARRGKVYQLINLLTSVGLDLKIIDIPEMALRNLAARLPEDAAGVALVAFDRNHGLMTLTRQGALYFSRRVDCGTDRLVEAGAGGELTPTLEALLDSLTIEIQRSLDFYERHFSQSAIAGIVLTPVPGLTMEVCAYLQAQLGVPTRWLDIAKEADVVGEVDGQKLLNCTAVIGASLREDQLEF